jgi:ferredoxin-NADP reductase
LPGTNVLLQVQTFSSSSRDKDDRTLTCSSQDKLQAVEDRLQLEVLQSRVAADKAAEQRRAVQDVHRAALSASAAHAAGLQDALSRLSEASDVHQVASWQNLVITIKLRTLFGGCPGAGAVKDEKVV